MIIKDHTRIDLAEGGTRFKQGDYAQLAFTPRNAAGQVVDLSNKTIEVAIWGNGKGVIYQADAFYDSESKVIRTTIDEILEAGRFQIEFTVTDASDPTYRKKFPSDEYNAIITITPSTDDIGYVGANIITVSRLRDEQTQLQQAFESEIVPQVDELKQRVEDGVGAFTEDTEVLDARMGETNLRAFNEKVTTQLADIVHLNVKNFLILPETIFDLAIERALASVVDTAPIELMFPRGKYKLDSVVTRRKNLTIIANNVEFEPQSTTDFMWTHYGDNFTFEGGKVEGGTQDTFRFLKITNDATTVNSSYANIKNVVTEGLYQAFEFNMVSGLGGAAYRHKMQNVRIRNANAEGRDWAGSFGVKFGGETNNDAAGNDSKMIDVFIKGYENNLIVERSMGMKMMLCSIDGGKVGIKYHGGSGLSIHESYLEYNTTIFEISGTPYRLNIFGGSYAHYTTIFTGALYNNEPINYIGDNPGPIGISIQDVLTSDPLGKSALLATKEIEFNLRQYGNKLSFKRLDANNIALETTGLNTGYTLGVNLNGKRFKIGNILSGTVTEFDDIGNVYPRTIKPIFGAQPLQANVYNPYIDKSPLYYTVNTQVTPIDTLRNGSSGMRVAIKVMDTFTTFVNSANLKTKTGGTITPTVGQVLEFGMFENGVWTQIT